MKNLGILLAILIFLNCQKEKTKEYKFFGKDLCNDKNGIPIKFLSEDSISKFGIRKVYGKNIISQNDTIKITFRTISDCCLIPKEEILFSEDSIKINNSFTGKKPCDSYCEYEFEYKIPLKKIKNKIILIE
ncbi:hypothetical protein [Flavobacterium pedocola]